MIRLALFFVLFTATGQPALADPMVRLVINEGEFGRYLSNQSDIAKLSDGSVMNVSFQYTNYDFRHPHLIADRYCVNGRFIRWGTALHPAQGPIDLVCIKGTQRGGPETGTFGN